MGFNEKAYEDLVNNPIAMIGVAMIFLMVVLIIWGIFSYPKDCDYQLYHSNITSMSTEMGFCNPQKFIDNRPVWQQKVLTLGTDNIALTISSLVVILIVIGYRANKKIRLEEKK